MKMVTRHTPVIYLIINLHYNLILTCCVGKKPHFLPRDIQPSDVVLENGKPKVLRLPRRTKLDGPRSRPLIDAFSKHGITWEHVLMCVRHGDNRHLEWLMYLVMTRGEISDTVDGYNTWMTAHGCKMKVKEGEGKSKIAKPSVTSGSQVDQWFKADPLEPTKTRWECFVEKYCTDSMEATKDLWQAYSELRKVIMTQFPTDSDKSRIAPLGLDFFVQFRGLYDAEDVHLYCHLYGMHAQEMLQLHESIGLYRNEAVENVHAQHKKYIRNHSLKGGMGTSMILDVLKYDARKLFRYCRCSIVHTRQGLRKMDMNQFVLETRALYKQ